MGALSVPGQEYSMDIITALNECKRVQCPLNLNKLRLPITNLGFNPKDIEIFNTIYEYCVKNEKNGTGVRFYITLDTKVIGTIALNNIVRGCFHSCFLGYSLDKDYINKGYMTEAVNEVTHYAFEVVKLHRIEANVMPRNIASKRVLEKCGFIEEGYSKNYFYINDGNACNSKYYHYGSSLCYVCKLL